MRKHRGYKFKKGDIVFRRGYTTKDYKVIGYNGAGMVLVLPIDKPDTMYNRSLFTESQLGLREQ
jgi:hypothetical protein